MESASSRLALSLGLGGAIFIGFMLFWFIRVYFKKRRGAGPATASAPQRLPGGEKRLQPRAAVSWPAAFSTPRGVTSARLKDISMGGAFVVCSDPLPLGKRFPIAIDLPDRGLLELTAEVIWSNANVPAERVIYRGMGIRFIANEEDKRKALAVAVAAVVQPAANA